MSTPRNRRPPAAQTVAPGPSRVHGVGLFANVRLPGRRKIGEVTGRCVRLPEARRRVAARPKIYLVEMSRRRAIDCSAGNEFRFLNHHCVPNCFLRMHRGRIEVYTLRVIRAGEELTIDYGVTPHRGGMICRCGAPTCRGRI